MWRGTESTITRDESHDQFPTETLLHTAGGRVIDGRDLRHGRMDSGSSAVRLVFGPVHTRCRRVFVSHTEWTYIALLSGAADRVGGLGDTAILATPHEG